jgi:hypothetical protein
LSGNFVLYRLALLLSRAGIPCPCLGNIGALFGISSEIIADFAKAMVVYFLISGVYMFFSQWKIMKLAIMNKHNRFKTATMSEFSTTT